MIIYQKSNNEVIKFEVPVEVYFENKLKITTTTGIDFEYQAKNDDLNIVATGTIKAVAIKNFQNRFREEYGTSLFYQQTEDDIKKLEIFERFIIREDIKNASTIRIKPQQCCNLDAHRWKKQDVINTNDWSITVKIVCEICGIEQSNNS